MSRGLVALLLVATLVISGGSSALVSWAVTSAAIGAQAPGADGLDGKDGADGADGADGTDGQPGAGGVQGAPGPRGTTGATGATGANGPQGPPGVQGAEGADAVLASVEMTTPDGSQPYTAGWMPLGTTFNVEAAPLILLTWSLSIEPQHTEMAVECRVRDSTTDAAYTYASETFAPGSSRTLSGSAVINLSDDATLELVCLEFSGPTVQQWAITDVSAYAVTVAT